MIFLNLNFIFLDYLSKYTFYFSDIFIINSIILITVISTGLVTILYSKKVGKVIDGILIGAGAWIGDKGADLLLGDLLPGNSGKTEGAGQGSEDSNNQEQSKEAGKPQPQPQPQADPQPKPHAEPQGQTEGSSQPKS